MKDVVDTSALIGYRLKRAQISLRSRMDEGLRPLGLTSPQYACLELIQRRPGASSAELARAAFVTRQTMSTLLKGLVARGLVERSERACAGRAMPTGLTAEGGDLLRRASAVVREVESRMISRLSDTQVEGSARPSADAPRLCPPTEDPAGLGRPRHSPTALTPVAGYSPLNLIPAVNPMGLSS